MNRSDTLGLIAPALVKALAKIEGAAKKATNGGFKTKYATLETVIDASKDILAAEGLTLIQLPGACVGGVLNLETILMHESGEWISGEMGIALGKTDPQGVGSALTYARRYAQMAALNMPAVDDDGEAAMGRNANTPAQNQRIEQAAPTRIGGPSVATTLTLTQRANILVDVMRSCKTPDDLRKAYAKGSKVCAELDVSDPERLVEINDLYKTLFDDLSERVAA
jgi:hypothetical protein